MIVTENRIEIWWCSNSRETLIIDLPKIDFFLVAFALSCFVYSIYAIYFFNFIIKELGYNLEKEKNIH